MLEFLAAHKPGHVEWLLLSATLFAIGLYGVLTRRNAVGILISVELMLNSAALNFVVFNRWGNKVFEATPYVNTWDGTSQFGSMFGELLPESTYYYVLDPGTGDEAYTGFIYLRR